MATPSPAHSSGAREWFGAARPGRDLTRFGMSIFFAAVLSAVQVFVIPRRVDVATYGEYRFFLVYVGYLGLLHLGLADGAYLRWAGRDPAHIAREWRRIGGWLVGVHLTIIAAAVIAASLVEHSLTRTFIVAFPVVALCINAGTLSSYALQASGDFRSAGWMAMLGPGLFVLAASFLPIHTIAAILVAYALASASQAVLGAVRVLRIPISRATEAHDVPEPLALLHRGVPVLGANLAAGLAQSADRMLVSVTAPIASFAFYGFASTVGSAANSATQALSRVALSHAAREAHADRAKFLGGFLDIIAAAYGLALIGEPLFERLVASWLPSYVAALPIVRALLVGMPFWIATHVVLVGTLQSAGLVRRQLALEIAAACLVTLACGTALFLKQPLWVLAASASSAAFITFIVGVWIVRQFVEGGRHQPSGFFVMIVGIQAIALLIGYTGGMSTTMRVLTYVALAALPTWLAARRALAHGW